MPVLDSGDESVKERYVCILYVCGTHLRFHSISILQNVCGQSSVRQADQDL